MQSKLHPIMRGPMENSDEVLEINVTWDINKGVFIASSNSKYDNNKQR